MNELTKAAVFNLVDALEAHPEDLGTLAVYGNLPQHLLDICDDFDDEQ